MNATTLKNATDMFLSQVDPDCLKAIDKVVLFGSAARGTDTPESDIDLAVFLNREETPSITSRLHEASVEASLAYDVLLSVITIDSSVYRNWRTVLPLYRNIEREGVTLWTA